MVTRLHLASIWPVKLFKKGSKLLDHIVYCDKILYAYVFKHFPATGKQNGYKSPPSNILAGQAPLVKMLIILDSMEYFVQFLYTYVFIAPL